MSSLFTKLMYFQILFAIVPPCSWWGGWLTFCVALIMIGLLTAVVGDLATIFGCLVGLKKEVTAITFVALGTSLPDLFASKTAAINEKYADASIGNVTGSNSVNVFLGLGTPWVIASIYHIVVLVSVASLLSLNTFSLFFVTFVLFPSLPFPFLLPSLSFSSHYLFSTLRFSYLLFFTFPFSVFFPFLSIILSFPSSCNYFYL